MTANAHARLAICGSSYVHCLVEYGRAFGRLPGIKMISYTMSKSRLVECFFSSPIMRLRVRIRFTLIVSYEVDSMIFLSREIAHSIVVLNGSSELQRNGAVVWPLSGVYTEEIVSCASRNSSSPSSLISST